MSNSEKEKLLKRFDAYTHEFDFDDVHIAGKYFHSLRVMERAVEIAESEDFEAELVEAAMVAGLLHDYSRFEQWTVYHTYVDARSMDHADRAVERLFGPDEDFGAGEIQNFYHNKKNYRLVADSIKYHNKYALPEDLTGNNLAMTRLVRDADKLDIIQLLTDPQHSLGELENNISESAAKNFFDNKMINSHDVKNKNDGVLLTLAMVYDLNYRYSFEYLLKNNLLEKLAQNLKNPALFRKYFEHLEEFVAGKV